VARLQIAARTTGTGLRGSWLWRLIGGARQLAAAPELCGESIWLIDDRHGLGRRKVGIGRRDRGRGGREQFPAPFLDVSYRVGA
jgi:hypothetical protein